MGEELLYMAGREIKDALYLQFVPSFAFVQENTGNSSGIFQKQINSLMPFCLYAQEYGVSGDWQGIPGTQESLSLEEILLAEAQEGSGEDAESGGTPEGSDASAAGESAAGVSGGQAAMEALQGDGSAKEQEEMSLDELLRAENEAALEASQALAEQEMGQQFIPHALQNPVDSQMLQDYESLVQNFYTIDSNTMAGSDQLDPGKLLEKDMSIEKGSGGPQILIFHTHSQETFADSIPGDESTSIVGVGDRLADILTQQYGYQVLHHKGQYDVETRDDAYSNALPAIEQVLAENPSIEVVIDLHRDQMAEETRLVMDLDGRPTARFMFFNGLSRTKKTGNISYLYNENQEENLAFSFQMQMAAVQYYPGLTRKIYLKGYRYNMHLKPRYLLVELGAQNNTVEEAMNACDPLAHILDLVLSGQTRQQMDSLLGAAE